MAGILEERLDVKEDIVHFPEAGPTTAVQPDPPIATVEQRLTDLILQNLHLAGDGGRGDPELLASAHEALMAGNCIEEMQALERGQPQHSH